MNKVSVGWTSIIGWITFAGSTLTTVAGALAEHQGELTGPFKWTAVLAIVAYVVTHVGRYSQAPKAPPSA